MSMGLGNTTYATNMVKTTWKRRITVVIQNKEISNSITVTPETNRKSQTCTLEHCRGGFVTTDLLVKYLVDTERLIFD